MIEEYALKFQDVSLTNLYNPFPAIPIFDAWDIKNSFGLKP
jgi:hypothetical protein